MNVQRPINDLLDDFKNAWDLPATSRQLEEWGKTHAELINRISTNIQDLPETDRIRQLWTSFLEKMTFFTMRNENSEEEFRNVCQVCQDLSEEIAKRTFDLAGGSMSPVFASVDAEESENSLSLPRAPSAGYPLQRSIAMIYPSPKTPSSSPNLEALAELQDIPLHPTPSQTNEESKKPVEQVSASQSRCGDCLIA